ncbi:MAG: hypothetical protein C75L2_00020079 [Leptospirillum sp. Group II 'C75']|jgi:hypothetical protein|uniref:hypothetical protein n=1 Tax=Leptospirillum sp. Group II 'CF-1' TaxID=1660083 RepID=UPI00029CBC45|nr:hypothetical protein [Leptospirillum sp. Group II 'CF-1']EIJ75181.1 MAG: hypothetical protein C75L2_00020079 [Leptospirillum sp. Group II 'C75']
MTALPERIREMTPHWARETIRPFDEDLFQESLPFVRRRYWCDSGSVNVFRIVGTRHPDYKNMNWLWMIENGKRMPENLELHRSNPGYYLETVRKVPEMTYITMDGLDFYVSTDGNHRSAIARFDFHYRGITTLHGVSIEDVRVDRELFEGYRKISRLIRDLRLPLSATPVSEKLSREDTAGWMLETFAVRIRIEDAKEQTFLEDAEAVADWIRTQTPAVPERKRWWFFQ